MEMQTWSIVIFCYNEAGTIEKVISKSHEVLKKMEVETFEVLVVDDGSTDGSREIIEKQVQKFSFLKYFPHSQNKGIGHALRTGYFNAKFENICAVPADGQFDLDELLPFANIGPKEFISFYRKENTTYSMARNALSHANKVINRVFNGFYLLDVNWVKIYKREVLCNLNLELESSLIESEICAKLIKTGHKPREIVSKYLARTSGTSKGASLKIVFQAVKDTYQLFTVLRKFSKTI
jgi:glycosyltransferase involved in cell wall biosynthesis